MSEDTPNPIPPFERYKNLAGYYWRGARRLGEAPELIRAMNGSADRDAQLVLLQGERLGSANAEQSMSDPVSRSMFFSILRARFARLPFSARCALNGLPQDDEGFRDVTRAALCSSLHEGINDSPAILNAILARRGALERSLPFYWSADERASAKENIELAFDRRLRENLALPPEERASAHGKLADDMCLLAADGEALASFGALEAPAQSSDPEISAKAKAEQNALLSHAKGLVEYPSLQWAERNTVAATATGGAVALGTAGLATLFSTILANPGTLSPAVIKGIGMVSGALHPGIGLAFAAAATATAVASFFGAEKSAFSRMDFWADRRHAKSPVDLRQSACFTAADATLCLPLRNLDCSLLSQQQSRELIGGIGFARETLFELHNKIKSQYGPTLGDAALFEPKSPWLSETQKKILVQIPPHELMMIGRIHNPALAHAFLFSSTSLQERLNIVGIQRKLDFAGHRSHPFLSTPQAISAIVPEAKKILFMRLTVDAGARARMGDEQAASLLAAQLKSLSPAGRHFAALTPPRLRDELAADLLIRPLDMSSEAKADADMLARVQRALDLRAGQIQSASFHRKLIDKVTQKLTKGAVRDPLRWFESKIDNFRKPRKCQSFDFAGACALLAQSSGSAPKPVWETVSSWKDRAMGAQEQMAQDSGGYHLLVPPIQRLSDRMLLRANAKASDAPDISSRSLGF